MYTSDGDLILHDGEPVARAVDGDPETAGRIASLLTVAERDEAWLDEVGRKFVHRNDQ